VTHDKSYWNGEVNVNARESTHSQVLAKPLSYLWTPQSGDQAHGTSKLTHNSSRRKRTVLTEATWRRHISQYKASNLSQTAYCDKHDIPLTAKESTEHIDSIGASLNLGVNELADVLHRFYNAEVDDQQ